MKKLNIILALGACSTLLFATACSKVKSSISEYKEEFAIKELNNDNYSYTKQTISNSNEIVGDYYKYASYDSVYKSIYTGREIYTQSLRKVQTGNCVVYEDYLGNYYDSFGDKINQINDCSSTSDVDYMIVAENSNLYKKFVTTDIDYSTSLKLKVLEINYLDQNEEYVAIKDIEDTHFKASNVYRFGYIRNNSIIESKDDIEILNDMEIRVKDGLNYYRYKANLNNDDNSYHSYDSNVYRTVEVTSTEDITYFNYLNIKFANRTDTFYYGVKKVSFLSNDFNFVYEGTKYKISTNGEKINCLLFPIYKLNKNKEVALILGKKILEDGNLSNTNYTFALSNNLKLSDGTDDISIFEDNKNYIVHEKLVTLAEDENLLVLNSDIKIMTKQNGRELEVTNLKSGEFFNYNSSYDFKLITKSSINEKYLVYSDSSYNGCYIVDKRTGYVNHTYSLIDKVLDNDKGIYCYENGVYILDELICSVSDDYDYKNYKATTFGQTIDAMLIRESRYGSSKSTIVYFNKV